MTSTLDRALQLQTFWKNMPQVKETAITLESASSRILEHGIIGLLEYILNAGWNVRVRVTGRSMAPFLPTGAMVTLKKVPCASLRRGDLILFKGCQGLPRLHRIVRRGRTSDGSMAFQTKGDALIAFDEPVQGHHVLGQVSKIEKVSSKGGATTLNMESSKWRALNHLLALTSLFRSKCHNLVANTKKKTPCLSHRSSKAGSPSRL